MSVSFCGKSSERKGSERIQDVEMAQVPHVSCAHFADSSVLTFLELMKGLHAQSGSIMDENGNRYAENSGATKAGAQKSSRRPLDNIGNVVGNNRHGFCPYGILTLLITDLSIHNGYTRVAAKSREGRPSKPVRGRAICSIASENAFNANHRQARFLCDLHGLRAQLRSAFHDMCTPSSCFDACSLAKRLSFPFGSFLCLQADSCQSSANTKTRNESSKQKEATAESRRLDGTRSLSQLLLRNSSSNASFTTRNLPDIDAADRADPRQCAEYVNEIYDYWFRVEPQTWIKPTYMQNVQTDINDKMRAILIDWLVEVHLKFKLMPETLFLTVNLIDRYLSMKPVSRKNLQLVGVTAMLLASKYEEIWAPEVRDFVYISDKAYTRDQILQMERQMLNVLKFQLTVPTPYQFMCRFIKAAGADKQQALLISFLVELCLPEYSMLKYKSSLLAAGAVYASNDILGKQGWSHTLMMHTRYTKEEVKPVACDMAALMKKAAHASLIAVHKKYSHSRFMEVARLNVPSSLDQ